MEFKILLLTLNAIMCKSACFYSVIFCLTRGTHVNTNLIIKLDKLSSFQAFTTVGSLKYSLFRYWQSDSHSDLVVKYVKVWIVGVGERQQKERAFQEYGGSAQNHRVPRQ